jgi:(1->4)-alpha-D-glucan 1-alpha-D-glucosylmutase
MAKAVREAKVHSSWINPDAGYEDAVRGFVGVLLAPGEDNPFLSDFLPLQARVARAGALTSLSQLLLRLASPGVPDVYQGSELWDFSLVDPDNRRPVDYARRRRALREIRTLHEERGAAGCARELLDSLPDGRIKLYLLWKTLAFRREHEALFRDGDYLPLEAGGAQAERVCAFARRIEGETLVAAVPRLFVGLTGKEGRLPLGLETWGETRIALPPGQGRWTCALTGRTFEPHGGELALAELFGDFPWALLHRVERE